MTTSQAKESNKGEIKEITLKKPDKHWVFKYETGKEVEFFRTLVKHAEDPSSSFDWFDAARLSHEMGLRLKSRLRDM